MNLRFPAEFFPGQGDVRLALGRVVAGQGFVFQAGAGAGQLDHFFGQFLDGEFCRVAGVDRAGEIVRGCHQADKGLDQVVHVAEGAGLAAVAVDGDRLVLQGLHDEVGHHPAVVGVHVGAVGVEDAGHLDPEFVLAVVVEEQGLGAAFALVVAGAEADGIDMAPVVLLLRVDLGVAVHLAGRGLEDLGPHPLGQAEHVDGAVHAGLGGLHRIMLVVDG